MNPTITPNTNPSPDMRTHDVVSPTATAVPPKHHAHGIMIAVLSILGVALIGFAVFYFFIREEPQTPEETLASLRATSAPVTATPTERMLEIKDMKQRFPKPGSVQPKP